jgi:large-conductance mechanosensitive channel
MTLNDVINTTSNDFISPYINTYAGDVRITSQAEIDKMNEACQAMASQTHIYIIIGFIGGVLAVLLIILFMRYLKKQKDVKEIDDADSLTDSDGVEKF